MAGEGSRFKTAGFKKPKPFIDVNGIPMIERVIKNLSFKNVEFILICKKEHILDFDTIFNNLKSNYNISQIIGIEKKTEGTACTNMFAAPFLEDNDEVIIANSDQYLNFQIENYYLDAQKRELHGSILTFLDPLKNPKWSFAQLDSNERVVQVKEKEAISNIATVGIYYFSCARDLIYSTLKMIINNDRVNNEFYTCPVYNYLIEDNKHIGVYNIDQKDMYGLGTPEDLNLFLTSQHA